MSINEKKLDFWIGHNLNVLFIGRHGVGKTSMVIDTFTRAGLNWRYFSAATMDPWVDFIGVPKAVTDENGCDHLDLIRPKEFQDDEIEALFFDEYNRAPKKVRNAVMELIQFKSINGKKFKRLRVIWAAVNPDDDEATEYDVEKLDEAQKDRFHVQIEIPYKPSKNYFTDRFGITIAKAALSWWDGLPEEQKNAVSPRRLDYALDVYRQGGDLRDVLPKIVNISELLTVLVSGPISEKLEHLLTNGDHSEAAAWLASENNAHAAIPYIIRNDDYKKFFLPDLPDEKLSALLAENEDILKFVVGSLENPKFRGILRQIVSAKQNQTLISTITGMLRRGHKAEAIFALATSNPDAPHFRKGAGLPYYKTVLSRAKAVTQQQKTTTYYRVKYLREILDNIPENLPPGEAEETMDFLDDFCHRSQAKTVSSAQGLVGVLNHCMQQIMSVADAPQTGVAFWKKYRKRFAHLFEWITNNPAICERVLNP